MEQNAVLFVIVGLVLAVAILYFVITFYKAIRNKKRLKKKSETLDKEISLRYFRYVYEINLLIKENEEVLKLFHEGKTDLKMGMITTKVEKYLEALISTKVFGLFFASEFNYRRFSGEVKELINTKSNLWDKKNKSTLEWFEKEEKNVIINSENERVFNDIKEKIQTLFK